MVLIATAPTIHQAEPPIIPSEDDDNTCLEVERLKKKQSTSGAGVAALTLDDSRQGSFDKLKSTMPSIDMANNNELSSANDNSGRDSPPSVRVRFSDSENAASVDANKKEQTAASNAKPSSPQVAPILASKKKQNASNDALPTEGTTLGRPAIDVFERLSKTETIAFINQKFLNQNLSSQQRRMKRSTSAPPSLRSKNVIKANSTPTGTYSRPPTGASKNKTSPEKTQILTNKIAQLATTSFELFERLAEKHTALSKSRRRERTDTKVNPRNKTPPNNAQMRTNAQLRRSRRTRRRSLGRTNSSFDRWKNTHDVALNKKRTATTTNTRKKKILQDILDDFDLESTGPPMEIEFSSHTKILCSNKFEPDAGFEEVDLFELGLNSPLSEYEAGAMSAKEFASEIMHALLWRDLPSEIKWDVKRPLERELAMPIGEIGYSFMIEATGNSILDEIDLSEDEEEELYTASATGNVTFLPDREIQVENYSCVYTYDDLDL